jgi:hypothetical protein
MAVVFESTIKINEDREWYIEIKDTLDGRVEICKTIEDYSKKIEELGSEYGGHIDEVNWNKDENVPPHFMDEIRIAMAKQQAEIEEETGKSLLKDD